LRYRAWRAAAESSGRNPAPITVAIRLEQAYAEPASRERSRREDRLKRQHTDGLMMDDGVQKSCWGVTAKAVIGFGGILLLAWLIGGAETAAVVAVAK
jgi:hypothetical protein